MSDLIMLLVDLTTRGADPALAAEFGRHFDVHRPRGGSTVATPRTAGRPSLICLEYDYPDVAGLALLKRTKRLYPSVPLIMVTKQHSEELAVWAFRSRAWDFLVKPVAPDDVEYLVRRLTEIHASDVDSHRRLVIPSLPMPSEVHARGNQPAHSALLPAVLYVEDNLGKRLSEKTVADKCKMSPFRFSRTFRKAYGITFKEYVTRARMTEACRLLESPHASISEVAYLVGFGDPSYFTRVFKKYFGVSPSDFRARTAQAADSGWPAPTQLILQ